MSHQHNTKIIDIILITFQEGIYKTNSLNVKYIWKENITQSIITFENKESRLVPPDKYSYNYNNIDLENTSIIFKSVWKR